MKTQLFIRDDPPFRWTEERRFLLRCELDAAFFHLYLSPETEWRQQPAARTQAFPTLRAAVSYILNKTKVAHIAIATMETKLCPIPPNRD